MRESTREARITVSKRTALKARIPGGREPESIGLADRGSSCLTLNFSNIVALRNEQGDFFFVWVARIAW